jgi:hypothetical protein
VFGKRIDYVYSLPPDKASDSSGETSSWKAAYSSTEQFSTAFLTKTCSSSYSSVVKSPDNLALVSNVRTGARFFAHVGPMAAGPYAPFGSSVVWVGDEVVVSGLEVSALRDVEVREPVSVLRVIGETSEPEFEQPTRNADTVTARNNRFM